MSSVESVVERLLASDNEENSIKILTGFIEENEHQPTVRATGSADAKKRLCQLILDRTEAADANEGAWSIKTQVKALKALRILARESGDTPLTCDESLRRLLKLADVTGTESLFKNPSTVTEDEINLVVEAVKCLCNLFLNNRHLTSKSTQLGLLPRLAERLGLAELPCELVYYDLRLLFLITACDIGQRTIFRDTYNGIPLVVSIVSWKLCQLTPPTLGATSEEGGGVELRCPLSEQDMNTLCECLKIIFNQTLHWIPSSDESLAAMKRLGYLISLILITVPPQLSNLSLQLITHTAEVLINFPQAAIASLVSLPCQLKATPTLMAAYPKLYLEKGASGKGVEGGVSSGIGKVYTLDIDRTFKDHNVSPILSLINALHIRLSGEPGKHAVSTLLTSLITISRGDRVIRTFLKSEILPPLGAVVQRPDEGDSLKSKIVRLMSAASPYIAAEEVSAEFLFILCKENVSRLVKYTGYGRAAGLLMSKGLLGGGTSPGQSTYSSDEEDSDTEEYMQSKLDVMTGGPAKEETSPLEGMTDEEKEREARELHDLIQKLNEKGIIQMAPLGSNNQPITFPPPPPDDDKDGDTSDPE